MKYLVDDEIVVDSDIVVKESLVVDTDIIDGDRVYVDSDVVTPYAVIKEYIPIDIPPTVTPLEIIDYGSSSIECAFDVSTEQAEEVVRGVLCGLENPPTFENADYRLLHGQGSMDLAFAGLHVNTEYYLRPYALSNLGYKYGDVVAQRTKNNPIPEEYQLVEWLYGSGLQYIVAIKTTNNIPFGIKLKVEVDSSMTYPYDSIAGQVGNNSPYVGYQNYRYSLAYKSGVGYSVQKIASSEPTIISVNYCGDKKIVVNDELLYTASEYYVNNKNFPLFVTYYNDIRQGVPCKIYYALITSNDITGEYVFQRKLYPVYRKSDNKPGLYDIVGNQFYTNKGAGEFTVGPDKEFEEE